MDIYMYVCVRACVCLCVNIYIFIYIHVYPNTFVGSGVRIEGSQSFGLVFQGNEYTASRLRSSVTSCSGIRRRGGERQTKYKRATEAALDEPSYWVNWLKLTRVPG